MSLEIQRRVPDIDAGAAFFLKESEDLIRSSFDGDTVRLKTVFFDMIESLSVVVRISEKAAVELKVLSVRRVELIAEQGDKMIFKNFGKVGALQILFF